jgi:hypothetical protein
MHVPVFRFPTGSFAIKRHGVRTLITRLRLSWPDSWRSSFVGRLAYEQPDPAVIIRLGRELRL